MHARPCAWYRCVRTRFGVRTERRTRRSGLAQTMFEFEDAGLTDE